MTNTASLNSGWEVAGGKKAAKKPDIKPKVKKDIPKIEHAQPISTETTIYDLIRESGYDSDSDEINNNKKQAKKAPITDVKIESPKKAPRKEPKESLNLVNSSIVANQKKKNDTKVPKNPETELENALKELKVENFEKELTQLEKLFQNNILTINENLISYLNKELDQVPEIDPLLNHENESVYPMTKLDKNVLKFLNVQLTKMTKSDSEKFFEYCLNGLFIDNQKVPSNHGHKIGFQLIAKLNPNLSLNLQKISEIMTANKHRHQRLLIALWAIGQFGYYNLSNGIKIWFDCMLGQTSVKSCMNFVSTYLQSLFEYHKLGAKSKVDVTITLDQYNKIADLNKAANLTKENAQKFKSTFDVLRGLFLQEVSKNSQIFENLLQNLPIEKTPKQSDMLELLVASLLKNKDSLSKWKQCYSKHMGQSLILLEEITTKHLKSFKSLKDTRETLKYFDEQTSVLSQKDLTGKPQFNRSKSTKSQSETDQIKKFNRIVKQINKEHYKEISIGSMVFKSLFYTILAVSLFFYWDSYYNKSVYTNSTKVQLKKYGLLDHTLKVIDSVKQLLFSVQKTANYYLPIWQKKFSETVVPVAQDAWKTSKVYGNLVWVKSEPYRNLTVQYTNDGVKYVQTNFPVVVKNLESCFQLAINYISTVSDFVFFYVSQFVEIVGVKLLGLKSGELGKIFLDGFKFGLDKLANGFQIMTEYFNKL